MESEQETNKNQPLINNGDVSQLESVPNMVAPNMFDLLKEGWQFVLLRRDLTAWYVALLAGAAIFGHESIIEAGGIISFVAVIASIVLMIFVAITSWGIIYAVSQPNPTEISYKQAVEWSSKNFFPLLWTTILVALAVLFGFLLLIIPGIALSIYLYFSLYAFAMGTSKSGVPALKQSYYDVKDRWWSVAGQMLILGLLALLIYLVAGIVYGILLAFIGESTYSMLVADVLLQSVVGGVVGVMSMYALAQYYKYLRASRG